MANTKDVMMPAETMEAGAPVISGECGLRHRKNQGSISTGRTPEEEQCMKKEILSHVDSCENVVDMAMGRRDSQSSNDMSNDSTSVENDLTAEDACGSEHVQAAAVQADSAQDTLEPSAASVASGPTVVMSANRPASMLRDAWTCFSVYTLVFSFCILGPILSLGWLVLPFTHGWWHFAAFVTAYVVTQCLPPWYCRAYKQGPIGGLMIRELANYMTPFTVIKEEELDPSRPYVLGWHPHGRLFYGFGTFLGLFFEFFPEIAGAGKDIFAGINDAMFRIPFLSNWLYLCGNIPCSKPSVSAALRRGDSVALIVGGIEEVLEGTYDDRDVLYLRGRKGFCKVAMDHGAALVPIFCFGENLLFDHEPRQGALGLDFWRWVNRRVGRVGAPFPIRGAWGLPVPRRVPMLVAVGRPVVPRAGETVDGLHARYVEALVGLHARHVGSTPYPHRQLVLV